MLIFIINAKAPYDLTITFDEFDQDELIFLLSSTKKDKDHYHLIAGNELNEPVNKSTYHIVFKHVRIEHVEASGLVFANNPINFISFIYNHDSPESIDITMNNNGFDKFINLLSGLSKVNNSIELTLGDELNDLPDRKLNKYYDSVIAISKVSLILTSSEEN